MDTPMPVAGIRLLDAPFVIDRIFDYRIPEHLKDTVVPGVFVSVPFGKSNKVQLGVVLTLREESGASLKCIEDVCPGDMVLTKDMMELVTFMQDQTLCTYGEAVKAIIPVSVISHLSDVYSLDQSAGQYPNPTADELLVIQALSERKELTYDTLRSRFGAEVRPVLTKMRGKGWVRRETRLKDSNKTPAIRKYKLKLTVEDATSLALTGTCPGIRIKSEKQLAVISAVLRLASEGTQEEIERECNFRSLPVLNELVRKNILEESTVQLTRNPYAETGNHSLNTDYVLNDEQSDACRTLCRMSDSGKAGAALLFGVTGSGKTCVIVRYIDHLIEIGKSVIVLLPEIALTPQSVGIFSSRYGDNVSVIHSALSAGQRADAYRRIRSGKTRIVIGTRSAVFAPVQDLGAIIIDEEQEHTYKSDSNPKYHARDIARFRCAHSQAVMLLASATPSVESYKKATDGIYTLLKLTKRYGRAQLPSVEIADVRNEAQNGNLTPIGQRLTELLLKNHAGHEQAILFLNRRGYNNYVSCPVCGEAVRCPNCSIAMTYHTNRKSWTEGRLVCHICGRNQPLPKTCPTCGSEHLIRMGFGTQRVEQELQNILPDANILRMDTDSTVAKFSVDEILGQFRRQEGHVLLGTQMVTKGHDFPGVTLVGVLSADASLYLDDYRAAERTFAMLTQVIGRAGRGDKPGLALIQTNNPDSDIIKLACAQDYEGFYQREIRIRQMLRFPPFCDIVLLTASSEDEATVVRYSATLVHDIQSLTRNGGPFSGVRYQLFGPFEAPVYRAENKYRIRVIVKCRLNKESRNLFANVLANSSDPSNKGVGLAVDFNPNNL